MNNARTNDQHKELIEFIRLPEVKKLVGLGTTKIYIMVSEGLFPKQVPLGGRAVAWIKSEVLQWTIDRVNSARGQPSDSSLSK